MCGPSVAHLASQHRPDYGRPRHGLSLAASISFPPALRGGFLALCLSTPPGEPEFPRRVGLCVVRPPHYLSFQSTDEPQTVLVNLMSLSSRRSVSRTICSTRPSIRGSKSIQIRSARSPT